MEKVPATEIQTERLAFPLMTHAVEQELLGIQDKLQAVRAS